MKIELEKELKNFENTYYEYNIDGNIVSFEQNKKGEIYTIFVDPDIKIKDFVFYARLDEDELIPHNVQLFVPHKILKTTQEIENYYDKLKYAKKLVKNILKVLECERHKKDAD